MSNTKNTLHIALSEVRHILRNRKFDFFALFAVGFFALFTVLGVFDLLPSDIEREVASNPISLGSALSSQADAAVVPSTTSTTLTASEVKSTPAAIDAQPSSSSVQPSSQSSLQLVSGDEYPSRIVVARVGINAPVLNPTSLSSAVLDDDLASGAVRYPLGADLSNNGNVFIFAHSSYLPIVHNLAYRTFDGLQNVVVGDEIRVEGDKGNAYIYRVTAVSFLKDSDAEIDLTNTGRYLTLTTCNVFGSKEDRIMVQAEFVRSFSM
jgi:LPXTG-site transpeptidase (sortase) family protein